LKQASAQMTKTMNEMHLSSPSIFNASPMFFLRHLVMHLIVKNMRMVAQHVHLLSTSELTV
jgi:hypothetical protein